MEVKEGPGWYSGIIALVRHPDTEPRQHIHDFYYVYSPLHCDADWKPPLQEGEELVELIPWRLLLWSEQGVKRSEEWWVALQPMIEAFWEDVEKAKRGEFIAPESTRITKRKKEEPCRIVFHKLDEQGKAVQDDIGSPSKKPFIPAQDVEKFELSSGPSEMQIEDTTLLSQQPSSVCSQ